MRVSISISANTVSHSQLRAKQDAYYANYCRSTHWSLISLSESDWMISPLPSEALGSSRWWAGLQISSMRRSISVGKCFVTFKWGKSVRSKTFSVPAQFKTCPRSASQSHWNTVNELLFTAAVRNSQYRWLWFQLGGQHECFTVIMI